MDAPSYDLDIAQCLLAGIIATILDSLCQSDVLRVAQICTHWRAAAVQHANYYCSVSLRRCPHSAAGFISTMRDAKESSRRVAVLVRLDHDVKSDQKSRTLLEQILPTIKETLALTRVLDMTMPYEIRRSLYEALDARAPWLDTLRLKLLDAEYNEDSDADEPSAEEADIEYLPSIFDGTAPMLRTVTLSGIRLGTSPIPVFQTVTKLTLELTVPTRVLPLNVHFPSLVDLSMTFREMAVPDNLSKDAYQLPSTVKILTLDLSEYYCIDLEDIYAMINLPTIPDVRVWCDTKLSAAEWRPYLEPLRSAQRVALRAFSKQIRWKPDESVPEASDIHVSLAAEWELGMVRTFFANDDRFVDPWDDWDEKFAESDMFEPFSFVSTFSASITSAVIAHEFLPLLFQCFKSLPVLTHLEIDLDGFNREAGPFWKTQATDEEEDFPDGDNIPIPWPKNTKPPRPADFEWLPDEVSDDYYDYDGFTKEQWRALERAECAQMLNEFDEEPEEYKITCPRLKTVRLRTGYENRIVQTRQLAHFGRALGLLKRTRSQRPLLLLRGVKLSSAKRGTLHLKVFRDVVFEPVLHLKKGKTI